MIHVYKCSACAICAANWPLSSIDTALAAYEDIDRRDTKYRHLQIKACCSLEFLED